jgi:hypothetical protein
MRKDQILLLVGIAVAVFVVVKYVLPRFGIEGFLPSSKSFPKCPTGYRQCPSGDCVDAYDPHQACPESTNAY